MKIESISVFTNPESTSFQVRWFDVEGKDKTLNTETFNDLASANIFAFELKKNQYTLNNL